MEEVLHSARLPVVHTRGRGGPPAITRSAGASARSMGAMLLSPSVRVALLLTVLHSSWGYIPPEQHRHEQLTAMQAAFTRFSGGPEGSVDRQDLPNFVRFVVKAMNSPGVPPEQVIARSTELTQKLMEVMPPSAAHYTLSDVLRATERIIEYPTPTEEELSDERGQLGSKQLRTMRKRLERNRLTMPLFDTRGWVRDFEKALKIQWEIYASGRKPMHILVARSDRIYGVEQWPGIEGAEELRAA